jgi:hypothetical protein
MGEVVDMVGNKLGTEPLGLTIRDLTDERGNPTDFHRMSMNDPLTWGDLIARLTPCREACHFLFVSLPDGLSIYQTGSSIGNLLDFASGKKRTDQATWELAMPEGEDPSEHYLVALGAIRTQPGEMDFLPKGADQHALMWLGVSLPFFV